MTMAGQILGIERFLHTHSNRVLAQFIYPQLRPKGRIFIGEPVLVQKHFVGNHLSRHIGSTLDDSVSGELLAGTE